MTPAWTWPQSTIVRVIDGDSLVAQLTRDIGFHGSVTFLQRLRLNRINTPPLSSALGKQAADYVASFAAGLFTITTVKPYKYGDEWMAEVVNVDGVNLSDALVAAGLAVAWDGNGPRPGG